MARSEVHVKLNIFEGARRIAMLTGGIYALGVLGWAVSTDPYVSLSFSVPELNAKAVMVDGCGNEDAREYLAPQLPDGSKASVTLCFPPSMSSDGRMLIPYRADPERADRVWMNDRYSSDVTQYTRPVAARFGLQSDAVSAYKARQRAALFDQWKLAIQFVCGGLAALWAMVALVGWIVRGFLGIPRGHDAVPPQRSDSAT